MDAVDIATTKSDELKFSVEIKGKYLIIKSSKYLMMYELKLTVYLRS